MTQAATACAKPVDYKPQPQSLLLTRFQSDHFVKIINFLEIRSTTLAAVCKQLKSIIDDQGLWSALAFRYGCQPIPNQVMFWKDYVISTFLPVQTLLKSAASKTSACSGHLVRHNETLLVCHDATSGRITQTSPNSAPVVYKATRPANPSLRFQAPHMENGTMIDCLALSDKYVVCTQILADLSRARWQSFHGTENWEALHVWAANDPKKLLHTREYSLWGPTNCLRLSGDLLYIGGHSITDIQQRRGFGLRCIDLKNKAVLYPRYLLHPDQAEAAPEHQAKEFAGTAILSIEFLGTSVLTLHQDCVARPGQLKYCYTIRLWKQSEKTPARNVKTFSLDDPQPKPTHSFKGPITFLEWPTNLISFDQYPHNVCTQMCLLNGYLYTASCTPHRIKVLNIYEETEVNNQPYVVLSKWDAASGKLIKELKPKGDLLITSMAVINGFIYTGSKNGTLRIWNADLKPVGKKLFAPTQTMLDTKPTSTTIHYIAGSAHRVTIGTSISLFTPPPMPVTAMNKLMLSPYFDWGGADPRAFASFIARVHEWNLPLALPVAAGNNQAAAGAGAGKAPTKADSKAPK